MHQLTMRLEYRFSRLNGGQNVDAVSIDNLNRTDIHAVLLGITWRP